MPVPRGGDHSLRTGLRHGAGRPGGAGALGPAEAPLADAPGSGLDDLAPADAPTPDLAALALREAAVPDAPVGDMARAALVPHPGLAISLRDGLEIAPLGGPPRRRVVCYPGGNVDPRAYAPPLIPQ